MKRVGGILSPVTAAVLTCLLLVVMLPEVWSKRYIVGGNQGWTSNVNYTLWARNITFYTEDWLCKLPLLSSLFSHLFLSFLLRSVPFFVSHLYSVFICVYVWSFLALLVLCLFIYCVSVCVLVTLLTELANCWLLVWLISLVVLDLFPFCLDLYLYLVILWLGLGCWRWLTHILMFVAFWLVENTCVS